MHIILVLYIDASSVSYISYQLLVYLFPILCPVPTAPVDLEMVDITANGFSLRWDPPSMPNGNINFYQVWLFTHNDLDVPVLNPINISSSSYNFTGLAPFTAYSVQVCAYTIGCGDIDTLNVTTLGGKRATLSLRNCIADLQ